MEAVASVALAEVEVAEASVAAATVTEAVVVTEVEVAEASVAAAMAAVTEAVVVTEAAATVPSAVELTLSWWNKLWPCWGCSAAPDWRVCFLLSSPPHLLSSVWRMMLALAVSHLPWQPVAIAMDLSSLADRVMMMEGECKLEQ